MRESADSTAGDEEPGRHVVVRGGVHGCLHGLADGVVGLDDERREEVVATREVAVQRRGGHLELPGDASQRERRSPVRG